MSFSEGDSTSSQAWSPLVQRMTYFSIKHPYGHHATVGTPADPATAVRGENFYHFAWRSIIGQYRNCWRLEAERCRKIGAAPYGWRNRLVRSYAMEAAIILFTFWAAGSLGVILFLINALAVHVILELANYTEHYGLVRDPSEPVQPRHSWNTNNRATYWYTVGIGRHSHPPRRRQRGVLESEALSGRAHVRHRLHHGLSDGPGATLVAAGHGAQASGMGRSLGQ